MFLFSLFSVSVVFVFSFLLVLVLFACVIHCFIMAYRQKKLGPSLRCSVGKIRFCVCVVRQWICEPQTEILTIFINICLFTQFPLLLLSFSFWCCKAKYVWLFTGFTPRVLTQFGVCTLFISPKRYVVKLFVVVLAVKIYRKRFLFSPLFLCAPNWIVNHQLRIRMLFAPTCRCTSVLFAMRMTLGRIGWSMTMSLCADGIWPADVPASTMTMTLHMLLLLLHHCYQFHLIHPSLHIHPCKSTPVSITQPAAEYWVVAPATAVTAFIH